METDTMNWRGPMCHIDSTDKICPGHSSSNTLIFESIILHIEQALVPTSLYKDKVKKLRPTLRPSMLTTIIRAILIVIEYL